MQLMFKKAITFFLIGVIFISSSGFGLIEHFCFMDGTSSTSLNKKHSCCPEKNVAASHADETVLAGSACCTYDTHFATMDLGPVVEKVSNIFINAFHALISSIISYFNAFIQSCEIAFSASDSSPPLTGRDILIRHRVLVI